MEEGLVAKLHCRKGGPSGEVRGGSQRSTPSTLEREGSRRAEEQSYSSV